MEKVNLLKLRVNYGTITRHADYIDCHMALSNHILGLLCNNWDR